MSVIEIHLCQEVHVSNGHANGSEMGQGHVNGDEIRQGQVTGNEVGQDSDEMGPGHLQLNS